jgi:hypothetical protein
MNIAVLSCFDRVRVLDGTRTRTEHTIVLAFGYAEDEVLASMIVGTVRKKVGNGP